MILIALKNPDHSPYSDHSDNFDQNLRLEKLFTASTDLNVSIAGDNDINTLSS